MDGILPVTMAMDGASGTAVNPKLLKKSHDLMEQHAAALLRSLPPPPSAPGVGGRLDVKA